MSNNLMFRQGDVLIMSVNTPVPPDATQVPDENGRVVLAHGEVTGHAHAVSGGDARLWALAGDMTRRLLEVTKPTALRHEEHGPIDLSPGNYYVVRQREYSPEAIRNVAD